MNSADIPLYLFDTFEGMSQPITSIDGKYAFDTWKSYQTRNHNQWCFASLAEVQANLESTGYESNRISFIKGRVESTIPDAAPAQISLLRLDTDWYQSTKHELEQLFPRLSRRGVLIIDDYGDWQGCKRAVDEYIEANGLGILLNRIDHTGRIAVKL
jgi:hypothetical protein